MTAKVLNIINILFIALDFLGFIFLYLYHCKVNACKGYNVVYVCDLTALKGFLRYHYNTAVRLGIRGEKKARYIFLLLKKWQHFIKRKRRDRAGKQAFLGFFYLDKIKKPAGDVPAGFT